MILAATKRYREIYAMQISVSLGYGKLEMSKYFVREENVPFSTCICFIVISRFGFEGGTLVLIVPVPAHCLLLVRLTFSLIALLLHCYRHQTKEMVYHHANMSV